MAEPVGAPGTGDPKSEPEIVADGRAGHVRSSRFVHR